MIIVLVIIKIIIYFHHFHYINRFRNFNRCDCTITFNELTLPNEIDGIKIMSINRVFLCRDIKARIIDVKWKFNRIGFALDDFIVRNNAQVYREFARHRRGRKSKRAEREEGETITTLYAVEAGLNARAPALLVSQPSGRNRSLLEKPSIHPACKLHDACTKEGKKDGDRYALSLPPHIESADASLCPRLNASTRVRRRHLWLIR